MKKTSKHNLVLDTHVWLWHLTGNVEKVNKKLIDLIDTASANEELWVSVISVWELAVLERKKRIHFNMNLTDWVEYSKNVANINVVPLNEKIVIDSVNLKDFNNHDPADRFIISTAKYLNGQLITRDRAIINYAKSNHVDVIKY